MNADKATGSQLLKLLHKLLEERPGMCRFLHAPSDKCAQPLNRRFTFRGVVGQTDEHVIQEQAIGTYFLSFPWHWTSVVEEACTCTAK